MKQNKKSGFALIAGIGIIALIAIVGFLVIKSNVIEPAKNAAAVLKANTTKTANTDTYGPNCPDCSKQEEELSTAENNLKSYLSVYLYWSGEFIRIGDPNFLVTNPVTGGKTKLITVARNAKKMYEDALKAKVDAETALKACIEKKKIYCDGYADALKAKEEADKAKIEAEKAKAAEEANALRKRALVK